VLQTDVHVGLLLKLWFHMGKHQLGRQSQHLLTVSCSKQQLASHVLLLLCKGVWDWQLCRQPWQQPLGKRLQLLLQQVVQPLMELGLRSAWMMTALGYKHFLLSARSLTKV
jgi:hypothetical protein